jgi:large subunit ribosomal protein L6
MSRIGKKPIELPAGVEAKVEGLTVTVKGPKGELSFKTHPFIGVEINERTVTCSVKKKSKLTPALWGTNRARIANLVKGVSEGFVKELELQGVGYKSNIKGKDLELSVGYSHPVLITAPPGITLSVEKEFIKVEGADAVLVGQIAADIRQVRKPEPYKGKGIRYKGERVRRKVGKVVGVTE